MNAEVVIIEYECLFWLIALIIIVTARVSSKGRNHDQGAMGMKLVWKSLPWANDARKV